MGNRKQLIREIVWITILALALACSAYALRPNLLPVIPAAEDAAVTDANEGPIVFVDLEAAIRHFEQDTAIFADARPLQAFNAGHIRGALHLAPQEFDVWSSRVFSEIAANKMVITYCDGEQCSLGHELAEKLIWLGYDNVAVLKDGWSQWQSRNMPWEQ